MEERLDIVQGDITRQQVDAIVNAANARLIPGGGVDGAIHRAAGPGLFEEVRGLGGCPPGEARMTRGHSLPARWVIHTVGPIWRGGEQGEAEVLARCYRNSLALAPSHAIETMAFPSISTGAYGFPLIPASRIALREILGHFRGVTPIKRVIIVCYDDATYRAYVEGLALQER